VYLSSSGRVNKGAAPQRDSFSVPGKPKRKPPVIHFTGDMGAIVTSGGNNLHGDEKNCRDEYGTCSYVGHLWLVGTLVRDNVLHVAKFNKPLREKESVERKKKRAKDPFVQY
jgi:hypothetical protein